MNFEHFRYVLELHNSCSISAACENLHLSRQALSTSLKNLEEELHTQLFIRTIKGVEFTDKGYQFLTFAQNMLQEKDDFLSTFYESTPGTDLEGHITISTTNTLRALVMADMPAFFYHNYPKIDFHVNILSIQEIIKNVQNGSCNFAITFQFTSPQANLSLFPSNVKFHPLFECKPFIWCCADSDFFHTPSISLEQALKYPFILDPKTDAHIRSTIFHTYGEPPKLIQLLLDTDMHIIDSLLSSDCGLLFDVNGPNNKSYYEYLKYNPKIKTIPLKCPYKVFVGYLEKIPSVTDPIKSTILSYLKNTFQIG